MSDSRGWLQPTATVIAAIIGLVGTVTAALIGLWVGSGSSEDLEAELKAKKTEVLQLQHDIGERDSTISSLQAELSKKDEEVASLRARLKPDKEPPPPSPKSECEESPLVQEAPGLRVERLPCSLRGDELKCDFMVTSTDKDQTLYLRRSRLIERDGKQIDASRQEFGNSVSNGRQVYGVLVRRTPMRATVTFSGINTSLIEEGVGLIELGFDGLAAQFRCVKPE